VKRDESDEVIKIVDYSKEISSHFGATLDKMKPNGYITPNLGSARGKKFEFKDEDEEEIPEQDEDFIEFVVSHTQNLILLFF
jgi:hypothetical protein